MPVQSYIAFGLVPGDWRIWPMISSRLMAGKQSSWLITASSTKTWGVVLARKRTGLLDSTPLDCDECRDLMDVAAGLALTSVPLEQGLPGFAQHIATCAKCREEYELLVYTLRVVPGVTWSFVGSIPLHTSTAAQLPAQTQPTAGWIIPVAVMTDRWLGYAATAQARADVDPTTTFERHLLLTDVTQTTWGMTGVEITGQRLSKHPEQVEIQIQLTFDEQPHESLRVTIQWADHVLSALLDEHSIASFTGIMLDQLFDTSTGQAKSDLNVFLSSAA